MYKRKVVDNLNTAKLVIFNRVTKKTDTMELHKLVRGISRSADIAYEDITGKTEYDEIEDPLPFDIEAPIIEINDEDYALWYRDLVEDMNKYAVRPFALKGMLQQTADFPQTPLLREDTL